VDRRPEHATGRAHWPERLQRPDFASGHTLPRSRVDLGRIGDTRTGGRARASAGKPAGRCPPPISFRRRDMNIRWHGQSAYTLTGATHTAAIDPFADLGSMPGRERRFAYPPVPAHDADLLLVTHEHAVAEHAHRIVHIKDGKVFSDEKTARGKS